MVCCSSEISKYTGWLIGQREKPWHMCFFRKSSPVATEGGNDLEKGGLMESPVISTILAPISLHMNKTYLFICIYHYTISLVRPRMSSAIYVALSMTHCKVHSALAEQTEWTKWPWFGIWGENLGVNREKALMIHVLDEKEEVLEATTHCN